MNPIRLKIQIPENKIALGHSRFWGNPDLPIGVDYPMYIDEDGDQYPYFFICQINLEQLASFAPNNPLPHTGLLSFFAKIDHYIGYSNADYEIGGHVSNPDAVKVLYFPTTDTLREVILVNEEDNQTSPNELEICFTTDMGKLDDEHILFAEPTHREWETWESPFEDWTILLQIDSFEGKDFQLNFMDFGVMDFLTSPVSLEKHDFSDVRGIILST